MERLDSLLSMLDHILNTKKKRHLAGGVLMSASLFLGGMAVTILTLKAEDKTEDNYEQYIE